MFHVEVLDEVQSTQDEVRTRLPADGLVVRAMRQTEGRGRHGRVWDGGEGNLLFSMALRPKDGLAQVGSLALVAGLALARAVGQGVQLKWPNDLLVDGKKCAGILCEVEGEFVIVGVGLNFYNKISLRGSVQGAAGEVLERFLAVFGALYERWQRDGFVALKEEWLALAHPVGAAVSVKRVDGVVEGQFAGLADDGALLLDEGNGSITTITSGELYVTSN